MTRSQSCKAAAGITLMLAGAALCGCSHEDAPNSPPRDAAAQNATVSNPSEGKPNHLSPEMQAQIDHYKSESAAAPSASPGH